VLYYFGIAVLDIAFAALGPIASQRTRHTYFEALEDKKRGLNERILRIISKNTNKKPIFALFLRRK